MNGARIEAAIERIEAALARIDAAGDPLAALTSASNPQSEKLAALVERHEAMREHAARALAQIDDLLAEIEK